MKVVAYNHVFVSHSRKDWRTKRTVEQGLKASGIRAYFFERRVVPVRSTKEIGQKIEKSKAFFLFFTPRSLRDRVTRDWIMLELGLALAHNREIYSWKSSQVSRAELPAFIDQLSTPREYGTKTMEGQDKLRRQVEIAARQIAAR